jgi:hypothetical protein
MTDIKLIFHELFQKISLLFSLSSQLNLEITPEIYGILRSCDKMSACLNGDYEKLWDYEREDSALNERVHKWNNLRESVRDTLRLENYLLDKESEKLDHVVDTVAKKLQEDDIYYPSKYVVVDTYRKCSYADMI